MKKQVSVKLPLEQIEYLRKLGSRIGLPGLSDQIRYVIARWMELFPTVEKVIALSQIQAASDLISKLEKIEKYGMPRLHRGGEQPAMQAGSRSLPGDKSHS